MPSKTHTYPARQTHTHTHTLIGLVGCVTCYLGYLLWHRLLVPDSSRDWQLHDPANPSCQGRGPWREWLVSLAYGESTGSGEGSGKWSGTLPLKRKKSKSRRKEWSRWRHANQKLHILIWNGASTHAPVRSLNLVTPYSAEPWSRDWSFSAVFRFSWKICKRRFVSVGIKGREIINITNKNDFARWL